MGARGGAAAPRTGGEARPARPRWWWLGLLAAALAAGSPHPGASAPERAPASPARAAPERPAAAPDQAARTQAAGGVVLEFPRGTGAALFRRGGTVLAVFDSPELRNPEALGHPAIAGVEEARALPGGFVLALAADRARPLGLGRAPSGWVLGAPPPRPPARDGAAAEPAVAPGPAGSPPALAIAGVPPNRTVVLRDPETGLPLLVGTTLESGRGSVGGRRAPEYDLLETGLGVAVLARSGSLRLQARADGFVLSGSVLSPLALDTTAPGPAGNGAAMTRCLGLPDLRPGRLLERLRSQSALLAGTELLERAARRRDLAATMLALGMGHEAQAELRRAAAEDPDAAAGGEGSALAAAAAVVAGRLEEAGAAFRPLPAPAGCDEFVLWRSLFLALTGNPQAALSGLRATLPLLPAYPDGLRGRLQPLVAGALAEAGAWAELRSLLADTPPEARPRLPAAMLLEADGDVEGALAAYDDAARGRDRRARAAALGRAVELRLRAGRIDAAAAARAYGPALVAWRGDGAEREARMRLARLLALAGDPGGALESLRQTAALFPDAAAEARRGAGQVLLTALGGGASPLAAVAAFQAGSDLLSPEDRAAAEARLANLLVELDLPGRAAAVLEGSAKRAGTAGAARAEAGWRLAALRLRENDPAGARAALDATETPEMPEAVRERRAALAAAIASRGGGAGDAWPENPADDAEAALGRRDWAAAARVLGRHLDAQMPAAPAPLDAGRQEAVLRLASAFVLAGDEAGFAALRTRVAGRMEHGPHAAAFARLAGAEAGPAAVASAAIRPPPGAAPAVR